MAKSSDHIVLTDKHFDVAIFKCLLCGKVWEVREGPGVGPQHQCEDDPFAEAVT